MSTPVSWASSLQFLQAHLQSAHLRRLLRLTSGWNDHRRSMGATRRDPICHGLYAAVEGYRSPSSQVEQRNPTWLLANDRFLRGLRWLVAMGFCSFDLLSSRKKHNIYSPEMIYTCLQITKSPEANNKNHKAISFLEWAQPRFSPIHTIPFMLGNRPSFLNPR